MTRREVVLLVAGGSSRKAAAVTDGLVVLAAWVMSYDRRSQQGPWLIRTVVQSLHRHAVLVPWGSVGDTSGRITLLDGAAGLKDLPE
jgi:hypothetical protein